MVNRADHTPVRGAGKPQSAPLSPNPSPPKPPIPARLESNFLSVSARRRAVAVLFAVGALLIISADAQGHSYRCDTCGRDMDKGGSCPPSCYDAPSDRYDQAPAERVDRARVGPSIDELRAKVLRLRRELREAQRGKWVTETIGGHVTPYRGERRVKRVDRDEVERLRQELRDAERALERAGGRLPGEDGAPGQSGSDADGLADRAARREQARIGAAMEALAGSGTGSAPLIPSNAPILETASPYGGVPKSKLAGAQVGYNLAPPPSGLKPGEVPWTFPPDPSQQPVGYTTPDGRMYILDIDGYAIEYTDAAKYRAALQEEYVKPPPMPDFDSLESDPSSLWGSVPPWEELPTENSLFSRYFLESIESERREEEARAQAAYDKTLLERFIQDPERREIYDYNVSETKLTIGGREEYKTWLFSDDPHAKWRRTMMELRISRDEENKQVSDDNKRLSRGTDLGLEKIGSKDLDASNSKTGKGDD